MGPWIRPGDEKVRHTNYLLKPVAIDNAKPRDKAYALTDGGGLLLGVLPSGAKTWRFKYQLNGKREKVTIGAYPNHFLKRIDFGVPDFSPHGRRGAAATLLREHGFGRDVVELLLAHSEKNATVAAYSHMELAADRKRVLQYLADRVDMLAGGANVLPLRAA
jgi:integrase